MALSRGDCEAGARNLAKEIFQQAGETAHTDHVGLTDAIESIDQTMNLRPNDASLDQGKTLMANVNTLLAEPFKGNSTLEEKGCAMAAWARQVATPGALF